MSKILKIRDEVDLKELEKFGFEKQEERVFINLRKGFYIYSFKDFIYVNESDRELYRNYWENKKPKRDDLVVLYNLIQANMVEVVGWNVHIDIR